jgi:hypothetical protein
MNIARCVNLELRPRLSSGLHFSAVGCLYTDDGGGEEAPRHQAHKNRCMLRGVAAGVQAAMKGGFR